MSDRDRDEVAILLLQVAGIFKGYGVGQAEAIRWSVECLSELWSEATPIVLEPDPTHDTPNALQ